MVDVNGDPTCRHGKALHQDCFACDEGPTVAEVASYLDGLKAEQCDLNTYRDCFWTQKDNDMLSAAVDFLKRL